MLTVLQKSKYLLEMPVFNAKTAAAAFALEAV